jgi:integrase
MKRKIPFTPKKAVDSDGSVIDAYQQLNSTYTVRKMIRPERINKDGLTRVHIEVRGHMYGGTGQYEDEYKRIPTKVFIHPKNWNKKKEIVSDNEPNADIINKDIDKALVAVKQFVNSKGLQTADQVYYEGLDLEALRKFFPRRKENEKCLSEYIEDYISFRKGQRTERGTYKEFKSLQNRLIAFDDFNKKKTMFEDITLTWADKFEFFLKNVATHTRNKVKVTGYNDSTVGKSFTILVTILYYFYRRKKQFQINLNDDFTIKSTSGSQNGFKRGKKAINEANPLTKLQLETLYYHEFQQDHLQRTKDRFLWQCYTGIRYVDAFTITRDMILEGDGWLRFKPKKTSRFEKKVDQPLSPVALEILEKYDNDITQLSITNQAYNRELRDMFTILKEKYPNLKYKIDYGTYASRDTFITMAYNGRADWKSILKWVGQSSYAIMDRYIKTDDATQIKAIKTIFSKPKKTDTNSKPLLSST